MSPTILAVFPEPGKGRMAHVLHWRVNFRTGNIIEHKTFDREEGALAFAAEHGWKGKT